MVAHFCQSKPAGLKMKGAKHQESARNQEDTGHEDVECAAGAGAVHHVHDQQHDGLQPASAAGNPPHSQDHSTGDQQCFQPSHNTRQSSQPCASALPGSGGTGAVEARPVTQRLREWRRR